MLHCVPKARRYAPALEALRVRAPRARAPAALRRLGRDRAHRAPRAGRTVARAAAAAAAAASRRRRRPRRPAAAARRPPRPPRPRRLGCARRRRGWSRGSRRGGSRRATRAPCCAQAGPSYPPGTRARARSGLCPHGSFVRSTGARAPRGGRARAWSSARSRSRAPAVCSSLRRTRPSTCPPPPPPRASEERAVASRGGPFQGHVSLDGGRGGALDALSHHFEK